MRIVQAWGMTETSPLASVAHPPAGAEGEDEWRYRARQGATAAARRGPHRRRRRRRGRRGTARRPASSRSAARGSPPTYYEDPTGAEKFHDGWLRTGDIAVDRRRRLHPHRRPRQGRHQVRRRVDLLGRARERADGPPDGRRGGGHRACPTSAGPSARWPASCSTRARAATADELREHLLDRVAKWWLPDEFAFIDEVPKTSVGKFDKKVLRARLAEGTLLPADTLSA